MYRGRLDATPAQEYYNDFTYGAMTNRHHRMYDSSSNRNSYQNTAQFSSSESSEHSSDEEEIIENKENSTLDFSIGRTTNSISIIDSQLFEEADDKYVYDLDCNPLEQGLFFKLLFKRFTHNFVSKSNLSQNTIENLLMTSIFSKLASIPLWDKNIETYYLHAFMYWELKNESVSLIKSMVQISNSIKDKSQFEEFLYLKRVVKNIMENPNKKEVIKASGAKTREEVVSILQSNKSFIESSLIFEEFLKEYLTIFDAKNELIRLMNIYEDHYEDDLILDDAIKKLTKVKKEYR